MIDMSRAFETVTALFGGGPQAEDGGPAHLSAALSSAGIDPTVLQGLPQGQIAELLAKHGVDPSALAGQPLSDLVSHLAGDHPLAHAAAQILSGRKPGGG
jgi:hypothetical protein